MAERSRAYVSDAFAHIPPWCNGSTRVFGTFGPGSNPGESTSGSNGVNATRSGSNVCRKGNDATVGSLHNWDP